MCHHHRAAITAAARNTAPPEQAHQARAHLAACTTCRRLHHRLQHQAEQHQRHHAITAVLPASALGLLHRLVGWAARRPTLPSGSGERAAQFAAGGGLAKAAAATTAVIAATATITNGLHTHHPPPRHHHATPAHASSISASTPAAEAPAPATTAAAENPTPADIPAATSTPVPEHIAESQPSAAEREFTPASETTTRYPPTSIPVTNTTNAGPPIAPAQAGAQTASQEFGQPGQ